MTKSQAYIILVAALVVVGGIAYILFAGMSLKTATSPKVSSHDAPPPPPSQEVREVLAKSKGFAALISYTDRGFEPSRVSIKQGEAVRFINNSGSKLLWIASTSTVGAYPGTSECGGSSFDTCKTLEKGEFWEFTFDAKGVWHYRNNSETSREGIVEVK